MKPSKRISLAAVTVLAGMTLLIGGCSAVDKVINKGGDTTCGEFNGHTDEKQRSEVAKMLKDAKGGEPSNLELSGTQLAVSAFCKTIGKDSGKISRAML